ncbi:MAG: alpha/beta fold hydrolase [Desulfobacter sp.]|nr:alpha/beta fold hydrolase [Desulfobacter sp.]WDP83778.1 MAG: alpha/beta fold hydrolase [Desulfobacter sp.]
MPETSKISLSGKELFQRELKKFETAYQSYFLEGETKPRHIGEPFLLHNRSSTRGILLVHGLMAAPEEVREWAQFLYAKGYTVYAPRLAGQGTSAVDLSTRHYTEWIESVDTGKAILKPLCSKMVIGGFSTGAGLALEQAIHHPNDFDGVISISAPLKFKGRSADFVEILHAWNNLVCGFGMNCLARPYAQNHPDNPHINYHRCPVQGIVQVKALMKKVYPGLCSIKIPALIIQGTADPKVDPKSGKKIFQGLSRSDAYYRGIDFHQHGIIRGQIAQKVFDEVDTFLKVIYPA